MYTNFNALYQGHCREGHLLHLIAHINPPQTTVYTYTDIIGERERANLVVWTTQFVGTSYYCTCVRITSFFLSEIKLLPRCLSCPCESSQQENCRPFGGIRCALRCLTEAVPLFNLRCSKVQVVNKLGWLVHIHSLCARQNAMHSPTSITSFCRSM